MIRSQQEDDISRDAHLRVSNVYSIQQLTVIFYTVNTRMDLFPGKIIMFFTSFVLRSVKCTQNLTVITHTGIVGIFSLLRLILLILTSNLK